MWSVPSVMLGCGKLYEGTRALSNLLISPRPDFSSITLDTTSIGTGDSEIVRSRRRVPVTTISSNPALALWSCAKAGTTVPSVAEMAVAASSDDLVITLYRVRFMI